MSDGIGMASDVNSVVVRSATPPASDNVDDRRKVIKAAVADIDEDELFELDIALLDGQRTHSSANDDAADGQQQHALLANCLLPVRSVSKAVPVDAGSALSWSSSYPYYSGYFSARRLVFAGGIGRRCLLGRPGNSARFCFSGRGFEAYFQRY